MRNANNLCVIFLFWKHVFHFAMLNFYILFRYVFYSVDKFFIKQFAGQIAFQMNENLMKHLIPIWFFSFFFSFCRERNEAQDNEPLHSGSSVADMFGGVAPEKCLLSVELCIACK